MLTRVFMLREQGVAIGPFRPFEPPHFRPIPHAPPGGRHGSRALRPPARGTLRPLVGEMADPVRDALSLFATGLLYDAASFSTSAPRWLSSCSSCPSGSTAAAGWAGLLGGLLRLFLRPLFRPGGGVALLDEFFARFNFIAVDYLVYRRE